MDKECTCCSCGNEILKGDRFIILSMETAEFYCMKCFIKQELVVLKVPEDTIKELTKQEENI
jgi:hypothetical protein